LIGLDANVLVRYFTEDDPVQLSKVTAIIQQRLTPDSPGYITVVAIVELLWVLGGPKYGFQRLELAQVVQSLLGLDSLVVQEEVAVFQAMIALKSGKGSFADALIGQLGSRAGCNVTLTFDRKAARLDGFELIG